MRGDTVTAGCSVLVGGVRPAVREGRRVLGALQRLACGGQVAEPDAAPGWEGVGAEPVGPGRLRVLLVVDDLRIGGAQRQVTGLAVALAARGHRVVLACTEAGPPAAALSGAGVRVVVLGRRRVAKRVSLGFAVRIARLARSGRFDVVHAHVHAASMAAALAGTVTGVPVVVTEHSMASWRGVLARAYSRPLYRRCAVVLAVSEQIRERLCTVDRVPEGRVRVVGTALFARPPVSRGDVPRGEAPTVGVVARLQPEKGVEHFVRAAALVAERHPRARFAVVGGGPLRRGLEELAGTLGVADRVRFLGARTDGPAAVAGLDVLCVPSLTEGAPLVVLEAMAAGVPVVAAAVGAIPRQLDHGRAGVLVPPADPDALAAALGRLVADPRERRRVGMAGRLRFDGLPDPASVTDAVEDVYRRHLRR
ncbi:glycosyltransferase [Yinghuangia seranimata]|uniref:glycosyltransferase n=1 Tax=Yinghuangia seranimata TaxID=408067 RepID=UPI00248CEBF2|nr:glycosyltransferase [Yinghuangia seranimata]MDI2124571.1 glycosyltransferase [Yinghuangia seranimata]